MNIMTRVASLPRGAKRALLMGAVVLAAVVIGLLWIQRHGSNDGPLRLYGNVDIREVQLGFREGGRVAQMTFDEGDHVTAGMRMAALDPQPYREAYSAADANMRVAQADLKKLRQTQPQEIARARAALNQAQAVATDAERNYHRQSTLLPTGASSQRIVDAARAARDQGIAGVKAARATLTQITVGAGEDIAAAEARLAAAQAARAQAVTALEDTFLLAPSDGTVISRVREPGAMVTSQSVVYALSLDQPVYVHAYIDEPDLGRIAPGMRVRVHNDSSSKTYHGQIGFISPRAEFTPKTVETTDLRTDLVYRLRVVVEDADAALRQGMPVTVEVDAAPAGTARVGGA